MQEQGGVGLDQVRVEIDVLELVLLGEHAGYLGTGGRTSLDENLAQALGGGATLLLERLLELLRRDCTVPHE